jgi:hypothetical protein
MYIDTCRENLSQADVLKIFRAICPGKSATDFGYKNDDSLKAAVSKNLNKLGFSKSSFTRELIAQSHAKFINAASKNELQQLIQQDLQAHGLKEKHIRDILQEMGYTRTPTAELPEFALFKDFIERGHSYPYAIEAAQPSYHQEKKLRHWFIHEHRGSELETSKTRRVNRQHTYLNLKDELLLGRLSEDRIADIWTAIGFIFADGSVTDQHLQIVITEDDGYYLSDFILKAFLDERVSGNPGPALIRAHSQQHETSFPGSKPVARLGIEDTLMASFIQELGMPANKTVKGLDIGRQIRALSDRLFYCFLCGLFDGDGSITHHESAGTVGVHLDFDLHSEAICQSLKEEIERRSGIPMRVYSQRTPQGKPHFKLTASTTPRALSLLACMYYHATFQLHRKVAHALKLIQRLEASTPAYANTHALFSALISKAATPDQFNGLLDMLHARMVNQGEPRRGYELSGREVDCP